LSFDRNQQVRIGEKFFRYRDYTPVPLIILLLIFGEPTVFSSTLGLLCIMAGELFRIYSVSFIGTVSRTRSDSTGQKLVIRGPFAYVRNPLYVGNFFVSMGFAIFSAEFWLVVATAVLFAVQYYFIVRYEESILVQKFGQDYEQYIRRVPAWFPSEWPSLERLEWPREFSSALKSEKRTLTTIFALLILLVALG
jgi:protein-S-isoprenylcysteine O-methyltransferase Ste14